MIFLGSLGGKMKRKFILFMACMLILCMNSQICLAGGMNGNEQAVYSVASGTFSYEGKQYRAKSAYLAELRAYLCRDDIDLDSSQASRAISKIYSSVGTGVSEGYLAEVSGSSNSSNNSSSSNNSETTETSKAQETTKSSKTEESVESSKSQTETTQANTPQNNTVANGQNDSTVASSSTQSNSGTNRETEGSASSKVQGSVTNNELGQQVTTNSQENTDTNQNKVENSQESNSSVLETQTQQTSSEIGEINEKSSKGQIVYDSNENSIVYEKITDDNQTVETYGLDEILKSSIKVIMGIFLVLAIIIGILLVLLFIKKCFVFQKNKDKQERIGREKLRKPIRISLSIILSIITILLVCMGVVEVVFSNQNYLQKTLNSDQYYENIYEDMKNEIHMVLVLVNKEEDLLDEVLTYDDFSFVSRNVLQLRISGKDVDQCYENIEESINAKVEETELQVGILQIYKNHADSGLGTLMCTCRLAFRQTKSVAVVGVLLIIIIGGILMSMDRRMKRGIFAIRTSIIASAVVLLLSGLYLKGIGQSKFVSIFPEYLQAFANNYMLEIIHYIFITVILGIVLGILLTFAGKRMHRSKNIPHRGSNKNE
jgi:hypothetical protein